MRPRRGRGPARAPASRASSGASRPSIASSPAARFSSSPAEPLGERRLAGARRRERGEPRLEPAAPRPAPAERVEPGGEPVEERPRLGRLAHLLERPHPGAQLVEPGERGLERRVLVADQPEELPGHRLQPLLGGARLGGERVEPEPELGLGRGRAPRAGRRRCAAAARRRRRARPEPPAPLPERQPEGAEGREPRHAQSRHADAEGLHDPSARAQCPCARPKAAFGRNSGRQTG